MKYQKAILMMAVLCSVAWIGCQEPQVGPTVDTSQVNRKVVDTYSDLAIQNAIITQHTLYPYHFKNNSAQLNGLGQQDLSVLVRHFKENPGKINVQQGSTDSILYQSRIQTVYEMLLQGGVSDGQIQIVSGMPGGDGMPSNSMIEILEVDKTADMSQSDGMDVAF